MEKEGWADIGSEQETWSERALQVMLECLGCGELFDIATASYMTIAPGLSEEQVAAISRVAHRGRIPAHVIDMVTLRAERDHNEPDVV